MSSINVSSSSTSTSISSVSVDVNVKMTARERLAAKKRRRETETESESEIQVQLEEEEEVQQQKEEKQKNGQQPQQAREDAMPSESTTTSLKVISTQATKVARTATVTQPTMERFSRRLAMSVEDAAAKEAKMNPFQLVWKEHESLHYLVSKPDASSANKIVSQNKIVGFDMDGTLIRTKSGRTFPTGRTDWVWFHPSVPEKLRSLRDQGFKIVIFSNQNGISTGKQSAAEIHGKILDMIKDCGVPMQAFLASSDDLYRKPAVSMFDFFLSKCNSDMKVDLTQCTYVGDAAGRAAGATVGWDGKPTAKKDFSTSDRKFAFNCKMNFSTPEEFFLNRPKAPFLWGGVDPNVIGTGNVTGPVDSVASSVTVAASGASASIVSATASQSSPAPIGPFHSTSQEIVVFVGFPASGKSSFAKKHFVRHGYVHVNQDTLKTKEKCVKLAIESLGNGKSVVVDNTNPAADTRSLYVQAANKAKVPIRCFHFTTSEEVAKHLNMFREKITNGEHRHVPRIAYASFKKYFQEPFTKEGFAEVKKIDFNAVFDTDEKGQKAKEMFYQMS